MRIQIVDDAGEVIHVPVLNQHLERDLFSHFGQRVSWWRLIHRWHARWGVREIERVAGELRMLTRY